MYTTVSSTNGNYVSLSNIDKFKTLVCPTSENNCKLTNFTERQNINMGIIP